jgi:hypothetical protein
MSDFALTSMYSEVGKPKVHFSRSGERVMSKASGALGAVITGILAMSAVACASAPMALPHTATLAASIPAGEEEHAEAKDTKAKTSPEKTDKADASDKADAHEALPAACAVEGQLGKDGKLCMPAGAYAKKLCGGIFPEVALGLFAKGTPFTRVYLAGDVEAWNASGGLTHRAKLAFDEEVIVLAKHGAAASGGIVMTGAQASFDVMRWDGSCVSVMEGELTARKPPAPKPATVPFSRLEETTRRALLAAPKVKAARDTLTKACSSVSSPSEKTACDKADKAFSQSIVDVVRAGAALPTPARRP